MSGGAGEGTTYTIVVRGELDPRYGSLFNGMQMEGVDGTTVITGRVIDQAQLHGFLARFEELGLDLLAVKQLGEPSLSAERG